MATKYSTQITNGEGPRALHAGLQVARGVYAGVDATLSASDTIQMVRIPNKAVILDIQVSGVAGAAATVVKIGDGGDDDRFGTVTLSATSQFLRSNAASGHCYQYSLSDDASPLYDTIDITIQSASSVTTTASIVLSVAYYMPPA